MRNSLLQCRRFEMIGASLEHSLDGYPSAAQLEASKMNNMHQQGSSSKFATLQTVISPKIAVSEASCHMLTDAIYHLT